MKSKDFGSWKFEFREFKLSIGYWSRAFNKQLYIWEELRTRME